MNRSKSLGAVVLLLILSISASANIVRADVVAGVKAGDWVKYNITGPSDFPQQVENFWLNATIEYLAGTLVWITIESNSTSVGNQSSIQVDIAYDCWIAEAWPFIVPANLSAGDSIPGGPIATINDTTQHFGRDAAHIRTDSIDLTSDWYWDRQTGVLLEASGSSSSGPIAYKMDSNNMWSGSPFGLPDLVWPIITVVIVVAAVLVGVFLMRRGKKLSSTPPPPQYQPPPPPPP